jgi:8-oxo-dGTP pyrophosphatase MutT (NUDIX family)
MVFDRHLEALVGQRALTASMRPREIDFFGGQCESDELPIDAAVREFNEETGLNASELAVEHVVSIVDDTEPQRFIRHYFMAQMVEFPQRLRLSEPIGAIALPTALLRPALKFWAHREALDLAEQRLSVA